MSSCQEGGSITPSGELFSMRFAKFALSLFVLALGTATSSMAGVGTSITWGTPQNISGVGDVSTNGNLVYAYHFGLNISGGITVNGTEFTSFQIASPIPSATLGNVTISESRGFLVGTDSLGSSDDPYDGLQSDYKNMLGRGVYASEPDTITLQLGGLTIGQTYDFQWWSNNSTNNLTSTVSSQQTTANATNSVTLTSNSGLLDSPSVLKNGRLGQYVIGRFTATGTTASIDFDGVGGVPLINAFQLRSIPSAVPEPSMLVIATSGLALGGISKLRRRKQS